MSLSLFPLAATVIAQKLSRLVFDSSALLTETAIPLDPARTRTVECGVSKSKSLPFQRPKS
jgi:hypothetical protein